MFCSKVQQTFPLLECKTLKQSTGSYVAKILEFADYL